MKKRLLPVSLTAILLCGVAHVQAAPAEELFTKIKVTLSTSNPPTQTTSNSTPSTTSSWRNKWLVISVEYTPTPQQKLRHAWIDDVSLDIHAIFNGQSEGRAQAVLFTGRSPFRTVPLDSRKHIATMMIPPQLLDRYLPSSGTASTVNTTSTFTLEAVFTDRAGTVLGVGYYGQRGWPDDKYAAYFSKLNAGTVLTVSGAILPRNRTPWAFHQIDDFDLLKPDADISGAPAGK